jgi:DNA primase
LKEKKAWVDFKTIKAAVTIEMALDHYGVTDLKRVEGELRGPCPIHGSSKLSKHLSVNPAKGAFKCFASTCSAHGNVLDFVAAMEKCSVRDAAMKLQEWFKVGESQSSERKQTEKNETLITVRRGIYRNENDALFEVIATARDAEDSTDLVVYRELFGEFLFWITRPETFAQTECSERCKDLSRFTFVKAL